MLFLKIFLSGLFIILLGGFAYFAMMDVPVHQSETVETLSAESFE